MEEDDKIQPLRKEQNDMKSEVKMNSLRLDMVIDEVQDLKRTTREDFQQVHGNLESGFAQVRADARSDRESLDKKLRWAIGLIITGIIVPAAAVGINVLIKFI